MHALIHCSTFAVCKGADVILASADQPFPEGHGQEGRWLPRPGLSLPCAAAADPCDLSLQSCTVLEQTTCLQVIDLGDTMDFETLPGSDRDELTCSMADIPTDDSNLVIKVPPDPLCKLAVDLGFQLAGRKGCSCLARCGISLLNLATAIGTGPEFV